MFTDIVGFTKAAQENESATLEALEEHRAILRPIFTSHGGREIKTVGDAFLIEFSSALDATLCAIAMQGVLHDRKMARGDTLQHRIGIHVGDVIEKEGDILGDAVNIASRIEPLAEPGGICISRQVHDQVRNKLKQTMTQLPPQTLKNVAESFDLYSIVMPWETTTIGESPSFPANRIAVLPFTSFSPDPSDTFFADGVTDEIISTVAGISGLSVISRTSVMGYKGTTKKVGEIGRELGVGSILEGSFKKAGNRIRVTAQLIDVAGDRHLWAQNYDRDLDDVFEVQSDVAKQVADALRVKILVPELQRVEKKPTENTLAYTLYLRGRAIWNRRGLDDLRKAKEYFELAVHEDPDFALGYVGIADCCNVLYTNYGIGRIQNQEIASKAITKALELSPELAEAHTTFAEILVYEYKLKRAEEEFQKAIALKPSYATAHQWYFALLMSQLRFEEARVQISSALELDPLSPIMHLNHAIFCQYALKNLRASLEEARRCVELNPELANGHDFLSQIYGKLKMFDEMRNEADLYVRILRDDFPYVEARMKLIMAWLQGDRRAMAKLLPEIASHMQESFSTSLDIAGFHLYLGEIDKGFEWLERAFVESPSDLVLVKYNELLDNVRTDPRYLNLLRRLGLE